MVSYHLGRPSGMATLATRSPDLSRADTKAISLVTWVYSGKKKERWTYYLWLPGECSFQKVQSLRCSAYYRSRYLASTERAQQDASMTRNRRNPEACRSVDDGTMMNRVCEDGGYFEQLAYCHTSSAIRFAVKTVSYVLALR